MNNTGVLFSVASELANTMFFRNLYAPLKSLILEKYTEFATTDTFKDVFKEVSSDAFAESYSSMTELVGRFERTSEGGVPKIAERKEGYKKYVENFNYSNSFVVTRNAIEDNKISGAINGLSLMMRNYWLSRNHEAGAFLVNAVYGTTTYLGKALDVTGADTKNLFATDHPGVADGVATQSNKYAVLADDISNGIYFSSTILATAETLMQNVQDDNGEIAGITPDTIIIPNDAVLKKQIFGVLGANYVPETANNAFNYLVGKYNVVVSQHLNNLVASGNKPFLMLDSNYNSVVDGLIYQNREGLRVRAYSEEKTENVVFAGADRHCYSAIDWREIAVFGISGGTSMGYTS